MKKNKVLLTLGIALASTVVCSSLASAAEEAKTTGKVQFETKEVGDDLIMILPGTYDHWITVPNTSGNQSKDANFRFSFVPNFNFGTVKVSTNDSYHNLKTSVPYQDYDFDDAEAFDATDTTRTIKYVPPFAQVENLRGTLDEFKVTAKAGKFEAAGKPDLENTAIEINQFVARNTENDKTTNDNDASSILKTPNLSAGAYFNLQTGGVVLQTQTGKGAETDGSSSSVVFHKDYLSTGNYTDSVVNGDDSVRLFVPSSDKPQVDVMYTSEILWTLENAN